MPVALYDKEDSNIPIARAIVKVSLFRYCVIIRRQNFHARNPSWIYIEFDMLIAHRNFSLLPLASPLLKIKIITVL